jgi:hypothetical protein
MAIFFMPKRAKNIYAKGRDARRAKPSLVGHLIVSNLVPFDAEVPDPRAHLASSKNEERTPTWPSDHEIVDWLQVVKKEYPKLSDYLLSTADGLESNLGLSEAYFKYLNFRKVREVVNALVAREPDSVTASVLGKDQNGRICVEPVGVLYDFLGYELDRFRRCPKCQAAFYGRSNQLYCSSKCRGTFLNARRREAPEKRAQENAQRRENYDYRKKQLQNQKRSG